MESRHRKVGHAPTRDSVCNTSHRRRVARGGAGMAVFRRGFLRPVDRSPGPRNLRFPAGEELAEKVTSGEEMLRPEKVFGPRRSDGGSGGRGFQKENKVTKKKHGH